MGSDELACASLRALAEEPGCTIAGVVTQPDKPAGRKRSLQPCALKAYAGPFGFPIHSPERIGAPESLKAMASLGPDLLVLVAYGQYIPESVRSLPPLGAINLHPSLLPKYRGASPIQSAILHGDSITGVTILHVSREMDAGDIIAQQTVPIGPAETAGDLGHRLAQQGAMLLAEVVRRFSQGPVQATPQDPAHATCVHKIRKEDARLDWSQPAETLLRAIRAYNPWPASFCECPYGSGTMLRIHRARIEQETGEPGTTLDIHGDGPLIAAGKDALRLLEVQPAGRNRMTGDALVRGRYIQQNTRLG